MNYFAHGISHLDNPWFLAGTAVPDWLSAADRKVRMRTPRVQPFLETFAGDRRQLTAGILQHLHDDHWFHNTAAFNETQWKLGSLFARVLGKSDAYRPSFLGHLTVELLIDSTLMEEHPGKIETYFEQLELVDAELVQATVNEIATNSTARLAPFIDIFREARFLCDYVTDAGLLSRINGVMRRIKLTPLPETVLEVLREGRNFVRSRIAELLPGIYPVTTWHL